MNIVEIDWARVLFVYLLESSLCAFLPVANDLPITAMPYIMGARQRRGIMSKAATLLSHRGESCPCRGRAARTGAALEMYT